MAGTDSTGVPDFVERYGLWSEARRSAAAEVAKSAEENLDTIRLSFADQHGVLRGKSLTAGSTDAALRNGCTITSTLLAKDTSHRTVYPVWSEGGGFGLPEMTGARDVVMVPDPTTFRVLPWLQRTGWMLCDLYFPDGSPVPFSTRRVCRDVLAQLDARGYTYRSGLEIEFHVLKLDDARLAPADATQPGTPPETSLLAQGFQYLTETRLDELEPVIELLRAQTIALGLPLRSMESEFGPSQIEFTFHPQDGLGTADTAVLFRSAVKQVCRRHGYHATFMCRPALPNLFSSGWHLHQSLVRNADAGNAFVPGQLEGRLSSTGFQFLAGILTHARAACLLTTPTINGYKRYRPHTLAPDRAGWGFGNRGSMLRVIGGPADAGTRIENRVGDPAANPYLYIAAQIISGLDGIDQGLDPGPPTETPYETSAEKLPASLMEAIAAFRSDVVFRGALGDTFFDYLVALKEAEVARFLSEVTDWEQREYFAVF
jgi:glutamine synthetase